MESKQAQTANPMDSLIQAMTDDKLKELKQDYAGNQSIQTLIDGILAQRKADAVKAKAEAVGDSKVAKLAKELGTPPDTTHNYLLSWRQVEQPTGEPAVSVTIIDTPAVTDSDGKIVTPAISHVEAREPKELVWLWAVTKNHACQTSKVTTSTGTTQTATGKRAITVRQVIGDTVKTIGNFSAGTKACEHLKLNAGVGSANLCLTRNGYLVSPYAGTDLIS